MHNAPLVKYPVGRFSWGLWLSLGLAVLTLWYTASLFFWGQLRAEWASVSWACVGLAAVLARSALRGLGSGAWLVWDGQGWQWWPQSDGEGAWPLGACVVQLDFQRALLLYFPRGEAAQGAVVTRWIWLYKGFAPAQWHGLRCAVYSRQDS